jgi:hypothetical protein
MLNNKASIDNGSCFFIPSQIKQKLFLLVVGDCYYFGYRHGIFQNILYYIQYKYSILVKQWQQVNRDPHTKYA